MIFELVCLALETDSTRIVTVCLNTGSLVPKQISGVKSMCHELTYHGGREEKLNELHCIKEAQFRALTEFVRDMNAAKEYGASFLPRPHFRLT